MGAAAWQYFVIRRQLLRTESDKQRYQQAIHFVTHEMRSPLTAIQGSSELMGRYALTEEKRKQMALMINNESKRLAKMIQTFLDIERLTDGQMEIKQEPFDLREVLETSVGRVRTLAERKNIRIELDSAEHPRNMRGDRELMEYAVYNLLTNAVKYSPADTLSGPPCRSMDPRFESSYRTREWEWRRKSSEISAASSTALARLRRRAKRGRVSACHSFSRSLRTTMAGWRYKANREQARVLRWCCLSLLVNFVTRLLVVEDDNSVRNTIVTFLELGGL